ncbi:MAG: HAD-IIIC family phosphatase [Acidimicrobiales bacterium]
MSIGRKVRLDCTEAPVALRAGAGATMRIGDRVSINYGTAITAGESVTIGSNVSIGPYCVIADADEATGPDTVAHGPIRIDDDVWLATRVVVMPGTRIGRGSVVTAGTIVSGDIPPGVVVAGSPARVVRRLDGSSDAAVEGHAVTTNTPVEPAPVRSDVELGGWLLSDFTIDSLAMKLAKPGPLPSVQADVSPFGQLLMSLMAVPVGRRDVAVVWTSPEAVSEAFSDLMRGGTTSREALLADVDAFLDLVTTGLGEFRTVLFVTWSAPPWYRGLGLRDGGAGGISWALAVMNGRLMQLAEEAKSLYVLDVQRWLGAVGPSAYNARTWYSGKIPFSDSVFDNAARAIREALAVIHEGSRKLIVVDLDDTMWGGIVGDVGWESLRLGGHDAEGEAFVDFQRALKALCERGVLLAIVSKNDEAVAMTALERHDEMVLRKDDFVSWRINWSDKAGNIAELVEELNLGLQSVVFIDDNPFERARVRDALPEVLVPEWPTDPTMYVAALNAIPALDSAGLSAEDERRTAMYAEERARARTRTTDNLEEWLQQLQITVTVDELGPDNLLRTAQLVNKTNQMNLRTRRLTEDELTAWAAGHGRRTIVFSVADRLGSSGLTGVASVERRGPHAHIVDFVMSCRVMGRSIERAMLAVVADAARSLGADTLVAEPIETAKNRPTLDFFATAGMQPATHSSNGHAGLRYTLDLTNPYRFPDFITLDHRAGLHRSSP